MFDPVQEARNNLINSLERIIKMLKFNPGQGFDSIQAEYNTRIYGIIDDYFNSPGRSIVAFRNEFRRIVNDAFTLTVYAGWSDGGGSGNLPDKLNNWMISRISQEIGYVDELFATMKEIRKLNDPEKWAEFAQGRADGYSNTLNGIYNYAKMFASKERPGKWIYGDTVAHCKTCASLSGTVHPLSWYLDRGYIPRQAGSETLECRGYNCDCSIIDPESGEQLIP